jgi:multiple antibiotic resistance protein
LCVRSRTVPEFVLNCFVTLLVVIDPIGLALIFAALTRGAADEYRRRMAIKGVAISAGILFAFTVAGGMLLGALGISIPAFRIAGGALLFLLALDMVFARQSGIRSTTASEKAEAEQREDISVFPLAIPLIAGPGALTAVLLFSGAGFEPVNIAVVLFVVAVVLGLTLLSLLLAARLTRIFGKTGGDILSRVLGVILAALAIQFIIEGLQESLGLG